MFIIKKHYKMFCLLLVPLFLFIFFQNFSPANSVRTLKPKKLPKVIVNHDLYAHSLTTLDLRSKNISPFGFSSDDVVSRVLANQSEIARLGAGFSLNITYGSHMITYWSQDRTYKDWLCRTLAHECSNFLSNYVDNIIEAKLNQKDLLSTILNEREQRQPFIVSVRMNDHHHVNDASKNFLSGQPKDLKDMEKDSREKLQLLHQNT